MAIPDYSITLNNAVLQINLSGDWTNDKTFPDDIDSQLQHFFSPQPELLGFNQLDLNLERVTAWNSALMTLVISVYELCEQHEVSLNALSLPEKMKRLIELTESMPIRQLPHKLDRHNSFLYRVGSNMMSAMRELGDVIEFLGNALHSFIAVIQGRAVYRSSDTWLVMQQTGAEALPIVSLLNFLVGAILGYIGAIQLEKFGAEIFIGDMVGVAMTREISAIITAIIMAGRSGAAFAAQIGTMKVYEEIDALRSMGFSPMEFLVMPRMIGMMLMMPLLAIYANFMGVLGGALVAYVALDISLEQYLGVVIKSVGLNDVLVGVAMSVVFGVVVSVIGCQKGLSCGKSAESVGASTTSAVVTSTVIIFVAAAFLTVFFGVLGI